MLSFAEIGAGGDAVARRRRHRRPGRARVRSCRARRRPCGWRWSSSSCPSSRTWSAQLRRAARGSTQHGHGAMTMDLTRIERPARRRLVDPQRRRDRLPAHLGDRPLQLSLHLLHARGRRRPRRARATCSPSRRSSRSCACFAGLGVRRVRLTGGEPTVRARSARRSCGCCARSPGLDEICAVHQRPPPAPSWRRRCARRASIGSTSASTRSTPSTFARITRRGDLARVLAGHRGGARGRLRGHQAQHRRGQGLQRRRAGARSATSPGRAAWSRASSSRCRWPAAQLYVPGALLSARARSARWSRRAFPAARLVADDGGAARGRRTGALPAARRGRARWAARAASGSSRPMTEHFCDACNRVRLSATGALHACLATTTPSTCAAPLRAGGEPAVDRRDPRRAGGKRDGHDVPA